MNVSNLERIEGVQNASAKIADPSAHPPAGEDRAKKVRDTAREGGILPAGVALPSARMDRADPVLRQAGAIDAVFQAAEAVIGRMKEDLEAIVKTYPPYPPGSEERQNLLQSYNGLRREIDRITLPRQDERGEAGQTEPGVPLIPADPHWEYLIDENGRIRTVAREDGPGMVHHSSSWKLPEVPAEASDESIRDALGQLQAALDSVQEKRARLWEFLEPLCPTDCYA